MVLAIRISPMVLFMLVTLGASSGESFAQEEDLKSVAKRHVADGLAAQAAGQLDEAISFYNQAFDLVPHPELLFNLGQAYRLKGEKARALLYYRKYLAIDARGRGAAESIQWTSQLEQEIRADEEAARKAEEERRAEAERKAEEARKAEEERKAEELRRREAARKAEEEALLDEVSRRTDAVQARQAVVAKPRSVLERTRGAPLRWKPLALGAAALAAFGGVYALERRSRDLHESSLDTTPRNQRIYGVESEVAHQRAIGLFVIGGALLGSALYMWVTDAPRPREENRIVSRGARLRPLLSPELAGVSLRGGF